MLVTTLKMFVCLFVMYCSLFPGSDIEASFSCIWHGVWRDGQLSVTSLTDRLSIFKGKQTSFFIFFPHPHSKPANQKPGGG